MSSHQKEYYMPTRENNGLFKETFTKLCIIHKPTHSPWNEGGTITPLRVSSVAFPWHAYMGPSFLKAIWFAIYDLM